MTSNRLHNTAASVRQRLANLARERNEAFQFILTRYGQERLLYRLSKSPYAAQFILKGAVLFQLWTGQTHRSTRDLDLLCYGAVSPERLLTIFVSVRRTHVPGGTRRPVGRGGAEDARWRCRLVS
jgi:hypothetical protein